MDSQSTGATRVAEEGLTLRAHDYVLDPNADAAAADAKTAEYFRSHNSSEERQKSTQAGVASGVASNERDPATKVSLRSLRAASAAALGMLLPSHVDPSIVDYEEPIVLTHSTHSFLFTEATCSIPFSFALGIVAISYICLILAFYNNTKDYSPGNRFSIPVGVSIDVTIAQYLALVIGLIMEEEIPESLYLLRMLSKQTLHNKAPDLKFGKFVFCTCVRVMMGYLFYFNMFIVVAHATEVIEIVFDVLALQFLQQVDDMAFKLAKMDVFGKELKRASTRECYRVEFEKLPFARRKKMTILVKALYIFNTCVLMSLMSAVLITQRRSDFQCDSITVNFGDYIWENALVLNSMGGEEKKDLFYSYFNGVYEINGFHDGRPVYTEQNKFNDTPYKETIGAVIKYCESENAWVFMHTNIRKDGNIRESDCPWLLRSPETRSFNLLDVSGDWSVWTGIINTGATFHTTCNRCDSEADCNYRGTCNDEKCVCDLSKDGSYPFYRGPHCEFPIPCQQLAGGEGDIWILNMLNENTPFMAYGRGIYGYAAGNLNITNPEDNNLLLAYSGSRWLGSLFEPKGMEYWLHYIMEGHAFWDQVYKESTVYVTNPTTRSDPIAVDLFKIGRRGARYGPLGELIPMQDLPGSGYFECSL